jgi:lactose/L-arabinose transport system substrate-binding protein
MTSSKILSRVAAVALAGTSFFAAAAAYAGQVTIWCWDPNFNVAIMKEATARYTKAHPDTTFNIVEMAKSDLEAKLQTSLASGASDALPDIVLIEDYGAQKYLTSFPDAFAPLTGKIDYSKFAPYKVALATVGDKTYSMPFDSGAAGLFYRRDYLEQAGFKPADLDNITWDRFIEIGKAVSAKTGKKMIALDVNDAGPIRIMMQSAGKWYFDKDGKVDMEGNAALKEAMKVEADLFKSGAAKEVSGWANWVGAFNSGDVATAVTGVWIVGGIKSVADQSGKWGVAPIPRLNVDGATNFSNLGGSSWYVLAGSKEKDEAADFLNEIYGKDVDFYQAILHDRGAVGTFMPSREGKAYMEPDAFFGGDKIFQTFSDFIGKIPSVNYGTYTNEADAAVSAQMPAVIKGESVDDAVKAAVAQLNTQIQQ